MSCPASWTSCPATAAIFTPPLAAASGTTPSWSITCGATGTGERALEPDADGLSAGCFLAWEEGTEFHGGRQRRGEHDGGGVLVHADLHQALQAPQLQRKRARDHRFGRLAGPCRGERLAFRVDDLGALLRSASACRAKATAYTSTLMLWRVMMPCDVVRRADER